MRDELHDALNEVALLTRIRNEEKRMSSERYMQLCAAESQLQEGSGTAASLHECPQMHDFCSDSTPAIQRNEI
jgi:hypothetical protein